MKALSAHIGVKRQSWNRVIGKVFGKSATIPNVGMQIEEIPEPRLPTADWVKVRSIVSGISDFDEAVLLNKGPLPFSAFLSFPFVPGNENVGIITETGSNVRDIEIGDRVVINPLLSCLTRDIHPICSSCAKGNPSCCSGFSSGTLGPGMFIGACKYTSGGWADCFVAHKSQVRILPHSVETDVAILVPEFARALRAVLQNPPSADDRIVIVGAGSLGILTLIALEMTGSAKNVLVLAEHSFEGNLARKFADIEIAFTRGRGSTFEEVARFVDGSVYYPELTRPALMGGADLVYETTGTKENVEDALYLTGPGKKLVLMGLNATIGMDASPLWFKGLNIVGTSFSGRESNSKETFDIALETALKGYLPTADLVTHRFGLQDHSEAFRVIADRAASKAVKVMFQHVV